MVWSGRLQKLGGAFLQALDGGLDVGEVQGRDHDHLGLPVNAQNPGKGGQRVARVAADVEHHDFDAGVPELADRLDPVNGGGGDLDSGVFFQNPADHAGDKVMRADDHYLDGTVAGF